MGAGGRVTTCLQAADARRADDLRRDLGQRLEQEVHRRIRGVERLDGAGPDVAMTALWALEKTYLQAWHFAAPGAEPYREVVGHWTTPAFADYVDRLAVACPSRSGPVVDEVLAHETAFWETACGR